MASSSASSLSVYGVAHDQRRLGRIEHDDGLAARGAAHRLDGLGRRFGELVDIGARAGARALAGDRRHDFTVVHPGNARYGRDHRDRGLAAAGHHVHVQGVQVVLAVDHGNAVRADGGGRQVDHADAGLERTQECVVLHVGAGAGGVEHEVDVLEDRQARQAFDPFMRGGHAQRRAGQTVRLRVDADHRPHFDVLAMAQDLDHQVRADVAAADDGGLEFALGCGHLAPSFLRTPSWVSCFLIGRSVGRF